MFYYSWQIANGTWEFVGLAYWIPQFFVFFCVICGRQSRDFESCWQSSHGEANHVICHTLHYSRCTATWKQNETSSTHASYGSQKHFDVITKPWLCSFLAVSESRASISHSLDFQASVSSGISRSIRFYQSSVPVSSLHFNSLVSPRQDCH